MPKLKKPVTMQQARVDLADQPADERRGQEHDRPVTNMVSPIISAL